MQRARRARTRAIYAAARRCSTRPTSPCRWRSRSSSKQQLAEIGLEVRGQGAADPHRDARPIVEQAGRPRRSRGTSRSCSGLRTSPDPYAYINAAARHAQFIGGTNLARFASSDVRPADAAEPPACLQARRARSRVRRRSTCSSPASAAPLAALDVLNEATFVSETRRLHRPAAGARPHGRLPASSGPHGACTVTQTEPVRDGDSGRGVADLDRLDDLVRLPDRCEKPVPRSGVRHPDRARPDRDCRRPVTDRDRQDRASEPGVDPRDEVVARDRDPDRSLPGGQSRSGVRPTGIRLQRAFLERDRD